MEHSISFRSIDFITFPATIFFILLLFFCKSDASSESSNTMISTSCLANQTGRPTFQNNLEDLLNNLYTTSATQSFANVTTGKSPDKAYAIYLCRGDSTTKLCQSCVTNLTQWVLSFRDGDCMEQFAYADFCMVRYANYSFFGKTDFKSLGPAYENSGIGSLAYNRSVEGAIEKVITTAAYNNTNFFAKAEADADGTEKVYALAQCTPDIDRSNCSQCLKTAHTYIQSSVSKGAWSMMASCQLRYNNVSFNVVTDDSRATTASVSSLLVISCGLFFVTQLLHDVLGLL